MSAHPELEQLEAALMANPDDRATHAAYADWLTDHGDPRGEFIQVQLALEDEGLRAAERKKLQKREQQLLAKHQRTWLGGLADALLGQLRFTKREFRFARGWLDALEVSILMGDHARALGAAPEARLLRHLGMGCTESWSMYASGEDSEERFPGLNPLAASPYLGNVRYFQWGSVVNLEDDDVRYNGQYYPTSDDVVGAVKKMPRLEELYVNNYNRITPDPLFELKTFTHLRVFQFCLGHRYPVEKLAKNRALGQLTSLLLHPQGIEEGDEARISSAGVRALLRSPHLTSLTQLRLHQTDIGDKGCEEIVRSGILKRLKVLDLAWGSITDKGAHTLARCPDLKNLEFLDLLRNALTDAGVRELSAIVAKVRADDLHDPGDESYLYEGDYE
jgi:uncharacterized protein (TIGR02996 family)